MSYDEFTGKTLKEAIEKACEELNVDEALLDVEVLEESSKGFLGIVGQRDARIRVRKRDLLREMMEVDATPARQAPVPEPAKASMRDLESEETWSIAPLEPEEPQEPGPEASADMEKATRVLEEILAKMTVEAKVEPKFLNGAIYLEIMGDGSGLLIGKKGQTLDALQFVVSKIVNRECRPGEKTEIIVDTENYRLRKRENLREKAMKTSQKARKTLKPVWLEPMPPDERRIVHMVLAGDREVYTKSHGEGPMRRIVVYPRRAPNKRRGR